MAKKTEPNQDLEYLLNELENDLEKVKSSECSTCWTKSLPNIQKKEFMYEGSVLGPFLVKNAMVYECSACGTTYYSRSESKKWEAEKAFEISKRGYLESGKEFKFLWQVMGKSIEEVAKIIRVEKITISEWYENGAPLHIGKGLCQRYLIYRGTNQKQSHK